jgi:pyruvate dehydrogenase E2 component (dihydrolipoamide acetyltransferase)
MATEIKMPPLSQTTDTVTLVEWLVKEGDEIEKGQPIADVETDKVTMQVESFTAGTVLKCVCSAGTEVPVGGIIAYIGKAGEQVPDAAGVSSAAVKELPANGAAGAKELPVGGKAPRQDGVKATPLVRNFASKRGVDLTRVEGSGPKGLIVKADVVRCLERGGAAEAGAAVGAASAAAGVPVPPGATEKSLSRNQQAVGRNLSRSAREIPHYTVRSTVYLDAALSWREKHETGLKVSIYSLYVYAAAKALKKFSGINGYFSDNVHYVYRDVNIGIAVAHLNELYVPVIRQADTKSMEEIDKEVRWLTAKTQNGKLEPEDISGGTFTISNLGVYAVDDFSAIISPGQAAILAIGRARKQVVVDEHDRMAVRQGVVLTGSFDHRIVNGAEGAAFLERMKGILEKEM